MKTAKIGLDLKLSATYPDSLEELFALQNDADLRCFDIVFQRPYRYFSIALKVILSLSYRYKIFTNDWL